MITEKDLIKLDISKDLLVKFVYGLPLPGYTYASKLKDYGNIVDWSGGQFGNPSIKWNKRGLMALTDVQLRKIYEDITENKDGVCDEIIYGDNGNVYEKIKWKY